MNFGIYDLFVLLGALGLFLYGMKVMSDALLKLAGNRMRSFLAVTTSNRFYALLTGFTVTTVIQSSSATTLMVVSFVNAQLLTLTEAVGVIMGANIGTTVTAWLISILGFKVNMSSIALPLLGVGFLMSFSKKETRSHFGFFLVGFSLLFIGLQFLKDSVPDIGAHPETLEFLRSYTEMGYLSILLFLFMGTVLTVVIQSSSATMALTLLMAYEGWIPFDMAVAMVLGENIGTTITANLAAIISNHHAKRAARAHLIFNLLGVAWVLVLFYPFIYFIAGIVEHIEGESPFVSVLAIPVAVSLFHTMFNILNSFFLIWFVNTIVKIVERMVAEEVLEAEPVDKPVFLNELSMKFPQSAIKALYDESIRLLQNTVYMVVLHGLNIHRKDLESDLKIHQLIEDSKKIEIDFDKVYGSKVKTIYNAILDHATRLQSQFDLNETEVERIRNLLIADRKLVQVVKKIKRLRENIDKYEQTENPVIKREYNLLKRRLLKMLRLVHTFEITEKQDREKFVKRLYKQRDKARELDVLRTGRIDKMLLGNEISQDMATSLSNDSYEAMNMVNMLVDIMLVLEQPADVTVTKVEAEIPVPKNIS